jgi:LPXTG-site transpeptidase (sortase) family protein
MKTLGLFASLLMLATIASMGLWWRYRVSLTDAASGPLPAEVTDTADREILLEPVEIRIPRFDIELQVKAATVSGNSWTIYDDAASWLLSSGTLTDGNMVIYAHNKREMFDQIRQLKAGDFIMVSSLDRMGRYKVSESFEARASDVLYVTQPAHRLTVYTCSGPLDLKRHFVLADLIEISSI